MDAEFLVYEGSTSTAGTFVVGGDEAGLGATANPRFVNLGSDLGATRATEIVDLDETYTIENQGTGALIAQFDDKQDSLEELETCTDPNGAFATYGYDYL